MIFSVERGPTAWLLFVGNGLKGWLFVQVSHAFQFNMSSGHVEIPMDDQVSILHPGNGKPKKVKYLLWKDGPPSGYFS
jgi:hypothetical protein